MNWPLAAAVAAFLLLVIFWIRRTYVSAPPLRADEVHWVKTDDLWHLRLCRFKPRNNDRAESVVLCHGLASNHYMFTFPKDHSLVDVLTEHGYDCWVVDLRGTRSSVPPFGRKLETPTVNDLVQHDVLGVLHYVQAATGRMKTHWVGHSMGGMLGYAHILLNSKHSIATLTTIGSPYFLRGHVLFAALPAIAFRWISRRAFRAFCLPILKISGLLHLRAKVMPVNWSNLHRTCSSRTIFDTVDAPPPRVLWNMALAVGRHKWLVGPGQQDVFALLPRLSSPLLAVFGGGDRVAPALKMKPYYEPIISEDKRFINASRATGYSADYDHADLLLGRAAREEIFEPIALWLEEHPIDRRHAVGRHAKHHPVNPVVSTAISTAKAKGDGHETPVPKKSARKPVPKKAPAKKAAKAKAAAKAKPAARRKSTE